jgi:hypothetical protein
VALVPLQHAGLCGAAGMGMQAGRQALVGCGCCRWTREVCVCVWLCVAVRCRAAVGVVHAACYLCAMMVLM